MSNEELAKLRKAASTALGNAAIYLHEIEPQRLIASKNFEKLILEHEAQALSSPVPKTPFN